MITKSSYTSEEYGSPYKITKEEYDLIPNAQKAIIGCQNCILVNKGSKVGWLTVEVV